MQKRFARAMKTAVLAAMVLASAALADDQVKVAEGTLRGTATPDGAVRMFKGIPFAAPPLGNLRWKAPQPAAAWSGVREADKFGAPCQQTDVYHDIFFRDAQPSEDCLNLDIWIPAAKPAGGKFAVLLWYYGGGFVAGGASEKRYDGEALARKGIIVVNASYRLGVFGFLAHPELSKESGHNSSGNYGLLDQVAALQWVAKNIAAFGGDPEKITIGGESAGSFSVSALMASPLSRKLIHGALGESGAFFHSPTNPGPLQVLPLHEAEAHGAKFAESIGAHSLADLRAKPADELLQAASKPGEGFRPILDGYYFPATVQEIFAAGQQSQVPLLAGWNADEVKMFILMAPQKPTAKSFAEQAEKRFGARAPAFLKLYPAATDAEALTSAEDLASDDFISFSTWKWIEMQRKTGNAPVYHYRFEQVPATKPGEMLGNIPASEAGSRHACEIEYVFGTLKLAHPDTPWTAGDFKVSEEMTSYWANFVKTGNPNGKGLPQWPNSEAKNGYQVMHLNGAGSAAKPDALRARYEFLDQTN